MNPLAASRMLSLVRADRNIRSKVPDMYADMLRDNKRCDDRRRPQSLVNNFLRLTIMADVRPFRSVAVPVTVHHFLVWNAELCIAYYQLSIGALSKYIYKYIKQTKK